MEIVWKCPAWAGVIASAAGSCSDAGPRKGRIGDLTLINIKSLSSPFYPSRGTPYLRFNHTPPRGVCLLWRNKYRYIKKNM